jgi:hypothetical protein
VGVAREDRDLTVHQLGQEIETLGVHDGAADRDDALNDFKPVAGTVKV